MPVGGWNGGHWSPHLPGGPSGYNGPDRTPPFHEWKHLTIDEQLQRAKDWRAQHSSNFQPPRSFSTPALVPTPSTPARSPSPRALPPRAGRPDPVTVAAELSTAHPYPDSQLGPQREPTFGGHRTPVQPRAAQQLGYGQNFNGQAFAHWHAGVPQGVPNQSITTPGPRLGPITTPETDTVSPVADPSAALPQQVGFERESSFDEDYKRWESQVVHGQRPVPTSHVLVPRVPAPGPPTTPFYVSPPPAPTRNDRHSIAPQAPTSQPASSAPLRSFESLTVQSQPQHALPENPSPFTANSVPSVVQAPRTEGQTSALETLDHPAAIDKLSGPGETGAAIESIPVNSGVGDEPGGSTTGGWTASDDPAVQRAIRDVEAQVEELEFQPLTAPVKEPSPPPPLSDTEAVSKKTAKNRAKKARQKANKKAKKAAAAAEESGDPEDHTDSDMMKDDGKRKATEDPTSPAAAKRVKHDDSAEPPPKPKMAVIPFPEKVCVESDVSPSTGVDADFSSSLLNLRSVPAIFNSAS